LVDLLHARSGKPVFLMRRGVDSAAFSPVRRHRVDDVFVIGYVGRLTPEKGVRFFVKLERYLADAGAGDFRIYIAGQGSEARWLKSMRGTGYLGGVRTPGARGGPSANLVLFVFPPPPHPLGNVVRGALASTGPAVVTDAGGPKTIVEHGLTGLVASTE